MFEDMWFDIPGHIFEIEDNVCMFGFVQGAGEYFLLGENFFRNYYTSYNSDSGMILIAPSKGSDIEEIYQGERPTTEFSGLKKD